MQKILVPFDGSDSSLRAVHYAAKLARETPSLQWELLHVLDPVPLRAHAALTNEDISLLHASNAARSLQPARQILDLAHAHYEAHYRVGSTASEIAAQVTEKNCDGVIMGTRGLGLLGSAMIGSVATQVVHLVNVPVTLIK